MRKNVILLLYVTLLSLDLIKGAVNVTTTVTLPTSETTAMAENVTTTTESQVELLKSVPRQERKLELLKGITGRIVNGTKAIPEQFPHQVSLRYVTGGHFCGASILTPKWILTAAHCVQDKYEQVTKPSSLVVVAGEINLKKPENARASSKVSKVIVHPYFNYDALYNDLALLELETPICFNNYVHSLPLAGAPTPANTICQVSGWGHTQFGGGAASYTLLYVELPIVDTVVCRKLMYEYSTIPTGVMCAGYMEGGRDACQGDSGGGMVCNGLLTGIVSGGKGCALPRLPGLYTDIQVYAKWINTYVDFHKEVKFCSNASSYASLTSAVLVIAMILHISKW